MLTRVVDPDDDLVSLDEVKGHLRVVHDDEDALIDGLLKAAIAHLDGPRGVLGRCIQPQTWKVQFSSGFSGWYPLPLPGVTSVSGYGVGGADDPVALRVEQNGGRTWIAADGVVQAVEFTAETPRDCWPAIAHAVKLLVAHWYEHR